MTIEAELLELQIPQAGAEVSGLETGTSLMLPPVRLEERLRHFSSDVFDLRAESHLVRFLKVLLGDAGAGQLRKRFLSARLQQTIHGSHFYDLDKFYGALFGVRRMTYEILGLDPYSDTATSEEWDAQHERDASYRSRIQQFARAISHGATPTGLELAAEAVLSVDCDVYESWVLSDSAVGIQGNERREFVVRPRRPITQEESYDLLRVLNRIKPADSRVIVDYQGIALHTKTTIRGVYADSEYWEVIPQIVATTAIQSVYQRPPDVPKPQPRPPFCAYQGEAWSYLADVAGITAYVEVAVGNVLSAMTVVRWYDESGRYIDYDPPSALQLIQNIQAGRSVSDGILVSHPYAGPREVPSAEKLYVDVQGQVWGAVEVSLRSRLPQLFADRISIGPLTELRESSDASIERVHQARSDSYERFWATPERFREDSKREVLEIRLKGTHRVNHVSFEVARFPHTVTCELYDEEGGEWTEVFRKDVLDSYPTRLDALYYTPERGGLVFIRGIGFTHPHHRGGASHWVQCSKKLDDPIYCRRVRIVLQRLPNATYYPLIGPLSATVEQRLRLNNLWTLDGRRYDAAYSLAVRNIDVGHRIVSIKDLPKGPDPIIDTSTDIAGSLVQYTTQTKPASGLLATPSAPWRSEPQPISDAVVNLYVDLRTPAGEPQVIDRFFIDPLTAGPSFTLYYSDDDGDPDPDDPEAFFDSVWWTPIARDYTLQKGFMHIPPTRAKFFKFEFTNLVAEPYETLVPITKQVKVFPPPIVRYTHKYRRRGQSEKAFPKGLTVLMSVSVGISQSITAVTSVGRSTASASQSIRIASTGNTSISASQRVEVNRGSIQVNQQISVTAARYAVDLSTQIRLRAKSWTLGFVKHHCGHGKPRFIERKPHVYDVIEIQHNAKVAFFVGLKELGAYRVDYLKNDNTEVYVDHFYDFLNISDGFTWVFNPDTKLTSQLSATSVATSKTLPSLQMIEALQFATQQSEPVQIAPDDDFRSAALATYDWEDTSTWHKYGDAHLAYSPDDNSVVMFRHVVAPTRAIGRMGGLVQEPLYPLQDFDGEVEDTEAVSSTEGGIESGILHPSVGARIYAAVRVTAESDLTSPLVLQIVAADGTLLAEKSLTLHEGQMGEWYVAYDVGSYVAPPAPSTSYVQTSNILDRTVQPTVTGTAPSTVAYTAPTPPDDSAVRIRLLQKGKTDDSWRLDTLSLFDEGIKWEFTVDDGTTWVPARGIRNNLNGIMAFPTPGNQLRWRATGLRPNMAVTSLTIRPQYVGVRNARHQGIQRGPNVSTFDQDPPVNEDPLFTEWTRPIPRRWFYFAKRNPALPVEGVPNVNEFSSFYGRPLNDSAVATDGATRFLTAVRRGLDNVSATEDYAVRASVPFTRTAAETLPTVTDRAVAHILPFESGGMVRPMSDPI